MDLEPRAFSPTSAAEIVTVPVQDRELRVSIYRPAGAAKGVLFLSHGAGGSPERMRPLIDRLLAQDFAIVAPLHRDSMEYSAEERDDLQTAFGTRIADLQASSALAARTFPGLPYGSVGYSYGSLTALIGGGALEGMVNSRVPAVKAVASFSSPGLIPGIVTDESLKSVAVPTLMITGTKDTVPGFIPEASQHVSYFEYEPKGDRTLVIVNDATHDFVYGKEPGYDDAVAILVDFLKAHVLNDMKAKAELESTQRDGLISVKRR